MVKKFILTKIYVGFFVKIMYNKTVYVCVLLYMKMTYNEVDGYVYERKKEHMCYFV